MGDLQLLGRCAPAHVFGHGGSRRDARGVVGGGVLERLLSEHGRARELLCQQFHLVLCCQRAHAGLQAVEASVEAVELRFGLFGDLEDQRAEFLILCDRRRRFYSA